MQLASQASEPPLAANLALRLLASFPNHFCFQKNKMATAKLQTRGFKTAEHKPLDDVTTATSIIYTGYGSNSTEHTTL